MVHHESTNRFFAKETKKKILFYAFPSLIFISRITHAINRPDETRSLVRAPVWRRRVGRVAGLEGAREMHAPPGGARFYRRSRERAQACTFSLALSLAPF